MLVLLNLKTKGSNYVLRVSTGESFGVNHHSVLGTKYDKRSAKGLAKVFVITGVRYISVLFHTFYYYWAGEYGTLYWSLCYIEFHCIG